MWNTETHQIQILLLKTTKYEKIKLNLDYLELNKFVHILLKRRGCSLVVTNSTFIESTEDKCQGRDKY